MTAGLNKIYLRGEFDGLVCAGRLPGEGEPDAELWAALGVLLALRGEVQPADEPEHQRELYADHREVCAYGGCRDARLGSPRSLVNPDRSMYSPRIGIAWPPKSKFTKQTVVRAGYGINYNTGQYASFAQKLAFQQPFAVTQTNTLSTAQPSPTTCTLGESMTLANGFNCSTQTTQSNYAVNPNYRLGMVQVYNLDIQRTLPQGIVLNIGYTGAYARQPGYGARAEPDCERRAESEHRASSTTRTRWAIPNAERAGDQCAEAAAEGHLAAGDLYLLALDRRCVFDRRQRRARSRRTTRTWARKRATRASTCGTS